MNKNFGDDLLSISDLPDLLDLPDLRDLPDPPDHHPPLTFAYNITPHDNAQRPLDFTQQPEEPIIGAWPLNNHTPPLALLLGPAATPGHLLVSIDGKEATIQSNMKVQIIPSEVLERQRAIYRYRQKRSRRQYGRKTLYPCRSRHARTRRRHNGRFIKEPDVKTL